MRFIVLLMVAALAACDKPVEKVKAVQEVFVIAAQEQPYHPQVSFNARIHSRSDVEIMAQVTGRLMAVHFIEGDQVQAGAKLFDIDQAPFKAAMKKAAADLAKARASETNAVRNFKRGKTLVKNGYISGAELDNLDSKQLESSAAVQAAEAALERARVDLEYTTIVAPQAGRVGRSIRAVGDVVGPQTGMLTTLVGQNDMDAVFQLPEALLLSVRLGEPGQPSVDDVEVVLSLQDGTEYPHMGRMDYFSNRIDAATGTLEVRARMANPDDILRPGMFVRATLRLKKTLAVLMVPQAAVQVDQRGTYVLAVTEDKQVTRKNIQTSERVGENVVVTSGLDVGTSIIVRGVQKARPGDTVAPLPYQPATESGTGDAP